MNLILPCAPGCCATEDCTIASDDFNRSNSSNINTGAPVSWSGSTGSYSISSNQLSASSTGRLQCGTGHPSSSSSGVVSVVVQGSDDGDVAEVWLNGSDANNCTIARVTFGDDTGLIEIVERVSSTNTTIRRAAALYAPPDTPLNLALYYDESTEIATATAHVTGNTPVVICAATDPIGHYSGVSVVTLTSTILFDDFLFETVGGSCETAPVCPESCDGDGGCCADWNGLTGDDLSDYIATIPMEVLFPSGTFGGWNCSDPACEAFDETPFALTHTPGHNGGGLYTWCYPSATTWHDVCTASSVLRRFRIEVYFGCGGIIPGGQSGDETGACQRGVILREGAASTQWARWFEVEHYEPCLDGPTILYNEYQAFSPPDSAHNTPCYVLNGSARSSAKAVIVRPSP